MIPATKTEITELTQEMVRIPSHESTEEMTEFLIEWLNENTDADSWTDSVGNVFAEKKVKDKKEFALVGHHDAVPPHESQIEDDEPVADVRDYRIYGRGTADMKGALAAGLLAFRDAEPSGCSLCFASFVDEEIGGLGAKHAVKMGFSPELAVVMEGSTGYSESGVLDVAVAHNGRRELRVTALGESSHASEPDNGDNAIYRALDGVEWIRNAEPGVSMVQGKEIRGSLVVTEIKGGDAGNVVPSRCVFTVDERFPRNERISLDELEGLGLGVEVVDEVPAMECRDEGFVDLVVDAASRCQGFVASRVVKPHATDAGWLQNSGVSCVVVGPSEPGEAHTRNESVSIDAVLRCAEIYRETAERF